MSDSSLRTEIVEVITWYPREDFIVCHDGRRITQDQLDKLLTQDMLTRALHGRMEAMTLTGEKLVQEHQRRVAETLLSCGLTLIPSEHLTDNQFVVSRGVFEQARSIIQGR